MKIVEATGGNIERKPFQTINLRLFPPSSSIRQTSQACDRHVYLFPARQTVPMHCRPTSVNLALPSSRNAFYVVP